MGVFLSAAFFYLFTFLLLKSSALRFSLLGRQGGLSFLNKCKNRGLIVKRKKCDLKSPFRKSRKFKLTFSCHYLRVEVQLFGVGYAFRSFLLCNKAVIALHLRPYCVPITA